MRLAKTLLASLLFLGGCATPPPVSYLEVAGLSPETAYKTFETKNFRFVYADGYFEFTENAANHFEHAHSILQPVLRWTPRQKTTVLIADNMDAANGFAMPLFRVGMVLIATPPETWFSTSYAEDWIKLLVFHEYVHFLNIDPTTEWMEGLRIVFGDAVRPNGLLPPWMLEGLAVYFETRTSRLGRGRSPYYEGILRAMVAGNRLQTGAPRSITLDRVNGDYPWFPGGEVPYLFGYHLWEQFSRDRATHANPEDAMGELSMRSSARVPYFIEGNLDNVMHKNWSVYWNSFAMEAKERLGEEIERVRAEGETGHEVVARSDFQALGGVFSPDGRWLAYSETSLHDRARLIAVELATGKKRRLDEKVLGAGLAFTPDSRYVIYSALVRENSYQLYSDLFAYDLQEDRTIQLTEARRAKDPAISPDGKQLAWLSVQRGTVRIESAALALGKEGPALSEIHPVLVSKPFSILSAPQFQNDRVLLFSNQELGTGESVVQSVDVSTGESRILLQNGFMNRNPVARNDRIFFVSNETGIENIHELRDRKSTRVTNVVTGTAFPFFSPSGQLHANLLTPDGYQIVKFESAEVLPTLKPVLASPQAPPVLEEALQSPSLGLKESDSKDYSPWSSMAPRAWSPIAALSFGSKSGTTIAGSAFGFDSTGKQQYQVSGGYNFLPKTFDGGVEYSIYEFRPKIDLSAWSETTNIATDFFGQRYRRNHEVALTLSYPLFWVRSSLVPSLTAYQRWSKVRKLSNGEAVDVPDFQFSNPSVPGVRGAIRFSNARRTPLGFMPEMGEEISLIGDNRFNPGRYSIAKYLASWKHYFDLGNHFVLRSKTQWFGTSRIPESGLTATDLVGKDVENPYDRGESVTLSQTVFRGYTDYPSSVLLPRQFGIAALDFHFPLIREFSGLGGTRPVFWKQIHGFVFSEALGLQGIGGTSVVLPSFGAGLSLDTEVLYWLPLRFNLEFQQGTRRDFGGTSVLFFSIEPGALL